MPDGMSDSMLDRMPEECKIECQNVRQIECNNRSVLGIGVRKRKYADTPLHQSVCFRRYAGRCAFADAPIPVFTALKKP